MLEPPVRYSWSSAICERDWINRRGEWREATEEERRANPALGPSDTILVSVPQPVRLTTEHVEIERCCYCGDSTIFGVYIRVDPATVPFPKVKE